MSKSQISSAFDKYQIIRPHLEQGLSLSVIAATHQLNQKTISRWIKKYEIDGLKGLGRKFGSGLDLLIVFKKSWLTTFISVF